MAGSGFAVSNMRTVSGCCYDLCVYPGSLSTVKR